MGHHRRYSGTRKLQRNRTRFAERDSRGRERVLLFGNVDDQHPTAHRILYLVAHLRACQDDDLIIRQGLGRFEEYR